MECCYCKKIFKTTSSLNHHQKSTKYCLEIQGAKKELYTCIHCNESFSVKSALERHLNSCKTKKNAVLTTINNELEETKQELLSLKEQVKTIKSNFQKNIKEKDMIIDYQKIQIEKLEKTNSDLQNTIEKLATHAISRNFEDKAVIEVDIECDIDDDEEEKSEEYKLKPLDVGDGYQIENRESDGYINVTHLCKAGGKQFKHWKALNKTFDFLTVLSMSVGIPTDLLIQTEMTGLNENRGTWVHPQVAINIAQWISPQFDVKVSSWVYEIMMTGKIDITNTKSYKELLEENKGHKIQIQKLNNKYVKQQPRVQYKESNVIYILTTKLLKKERRYILGKATNLTNRLSTYNKSDEHDVVYYQECPDVESMSVVETMVFQRLKKHREQANRERFILPKGEHIDLFRDVVRETIEFVMKER